MAEKVKSLTSLFNNPALSDVKIKQISNGKTREYFAHKAILCKESEYFMNAFTGNFKVRVHPGVIDRLTLTLYKEASDPEMEIHDDDPDDFESVLKFIYTGDYDKDAIEKTSNGDKAKRMSIPLGIYSIADKYGIQRLYAPATDDVLTALKSIPVNEIDEMLLIVVRTHYETILDANTPIGKMLVSFILDQGREILGSDNFRISMENFPIFAADVALGLSREGFFKYKRARCSCGWTVFHDPVAEKLSRNKKVHCYSCAKWLYGA